MLLNSTFHPPDKINISHSIQEPTIKPSPVDTMEYLVTTHGLDTVLEALIKVLKRMKNPEHLIFTLYLFGKRALREITKGN